PCDRPGTLALGDALASDAPLQLGQLGLATHVHPTLAGGSSAVIGTLYDPLALVLRQGAQERDEAAANRRGEVQVWLVEHLDHGCMDPLDDVHAIHHRPGGAVPRTVVSNCNKVGTQSTGFGSLSPRPGMAEGAV